MSELELAGKRVLIREDLNVPLNKGKVANDARIRACLPTIRAAVKAGAKVILMSHLGRPKAGEYDESLSLAPVAARLGEYLGEEIPLIKDWLDLATGINDGEVVLLENLRFIKGETENDAALAKKMASLCDVYVMDAFGSAHRAHASTHGVAKLATTACAGPLLVAELDALGNALLDPAKPLVAIVAGSKVSSKLSLLENLIKKVDRLILGGGIANTFLAAEGLPIGKSLYEADLVDTAKDLIDKAKMRGVTIPLPVDVVCAKEFSINSAAETKATAFVGTDDMILDIGPQTATDVSVLLEDAGTIVWNGPVGVFEFPAFSKGTETLAKAVANSKAFSIAGGGDTLAAVEQYGIADKISYISTGGGAFLEFLEGKTLPAVAVLEERSKS